MKNRIVLVMNGKGGVGKSFFAINFVQFLKDRGLPHLAIDSDNENSTLKRFHPEAEFLDVATPRSLDGMFHALKRAPLVVVDCRAASTDLFFDYFNSIDLTTAAKAMDTEFTIAMPVNHEPDSVEQVQRIVGKLATACCFVVVKNAVHSETFQLYDQSVVRGRICKELAGREISVARLQTSLVEELNQANLTAATGAKHERFHLLDRQRLLTWQRGFVAQIETAADLLFSQPQPESKSHAR